MAIEFNLRFAVVEATRDYLLRSPFRAFRLRLHDVSVIEITNPDLLSVTKAGAIVFDDGQVVRTLNPALIASVEQTSAES